MADTDKRVGSIMGIYIDGTKVAQTTSISESYSMNTADVTSADSTDEEVLPTYGAGSISGDFLEAPESSDINFKDLFDLYNAKTKVTVRISEDAFAGTVTTFDGYITDLSREIPFADAISGSYTITKSGAATVSDFT